MSKRIFYLFITVFAAYFFIISCGQQAEIVWPESPLYDAPEDDPFWNPPSSLAEAKSALEGHYAHYDIVAYEEMQSSGPMRTFIISYGFTDLYLEGDALIERDQFCSASYKMNQKNIKFSFPDEATQAILPRVKEVEVYQKDGKWMIHRPQTPTLLCIYGDPDLPLTTDVNDPNIFDADGDGKPGVTVFISVSSFIKGELYLIRREIFQNYLTLHSGGILFGSVVDDSEQLIIGANKSMFNKPSNPDQQPDLGLSPMMLIPISDDIDTCEELMERRDEFFPKEPNFLNF